MKAIGRKHLQETARTTSWSLLFWALLVCLALPSVTRSTDDVMWKFVAGADTTNVTGVYGTLDVAHADNRPGGSHSGVSWSAGDGTLWMFGGFGFAATGPTFGMLNHLWQFDPATGLWTWRGGSDTTDQPGNYGTKGVAAASNMPGARRNAAGFVDANGGMWLFGGYGMGASPTHMGALNDLWFYNPSNHFWTWVAGSDQADQQGIYGTLGESAPTNAPGGRFATVAWADFLGRIHVFGGDGFPESGGSGYLNDLWRLDQGTMEWTWIAGSNTANPPGVYGTLGDFGAANVPGGRRHMTVWPESDGSVTVFGGLGYGESGPLGRLGDLWRHDAASNQWAWIKGPKLVDQLGAYGTLKSEDSANNPGGRQFCVGWSDQAGKRWLFGGYGFASSGIVAYLNDLWRHDPTTGNWTWMGGSTTTNQTGTYGTRGVAHPDNQPGARSNAMGWHAPDDTQWVFGGAGYATTATEGFLGDLWQLAPGAPTHVPDWQLMNE